MIKISIRNQILLFLCLFLAVDNSAFALQSVNLQQSFPVWTFKALTPTKIIVAKNATKLIKYTVTNQSAITHHLVMQPIPGITQLTEGPGFCSKEFTLTFGSSCILSLEVHGAQMRHRIYDGPIVCHRASPLECYRPSYADILDIGLGEDQYTVGGQITGLIGTLTLLNNNSDPLSRNSDGQYTFTTPLGESQPYFVTVSAQPSNQICSVSNPSGIIGTQNVTNVNVVCSTNAYTVGGNVSGLSGAIVLSNNSSDDLSITSDGSFTFPTPIAEGSPYTVTIKNQPIGQTCSLSNGSGIMGGANVTNVTVVCSANAHTLGGSISGLNPSASLTLLNNGQDDKIINNNGNFVFDMPVSEGSSYNVTVGVQPSGQSCNVSNGSGVMGNVTINNVAVLCANATTTLSVASNAEIPVSLIGETNSITVTNTGSHIAHNIHINLPSGWTEVTQDASSCASLAPGNSCSLVLSSTQAYVAQENIVVTGDNINSPPTMAIAFTVEGYLVFEVLNSDKVIVIDSNDLPLSPVQWSPVFQIIGANAQSLIDGFNNTLTIVNVLGTSISYAAEGCYQKDPIEHAWYLPALCQMGESDACSGLANINTNLAQLGFGGFTNSSYWSSTEDSNQAFTQAWTQQFNIVSTQETKSKTSSHFVRCVRVFQLLDK